MSEEPSLIDRIRSEVLDASWDVLVPHQARGALLAVYDGLQVVDAALAIAENQAAIIQAWLASGHLRKVETAQWNQWSERRFQAAVVQPFVVVALLDELDGDTP
jgi:hypothetical protein